MSESITVEVPGEPQGKGRARIVKIAGFSRMATPQKTVAYEGLIALAAKQAMRGADAFTGPVVLSIEVLHAVPASWSQRRRQDALAGRLVPVRKPDVDNVLKAVGDGCNGVLWIDDKQIVQIALDRRFSATPMLRFTAWPMPVGGA